MCIRDSVHTVNDDHHLYELPLETQNIILDWVFWNFYPAQKIYPHLTSDDLKEEMCIRDRNDSLPVIQKERKK